MTNILSKRTTQPESRMKVAISLKDTVEVGAVIPADTASIINFRRYSPKRGRTLCRSTKTILNTVRLGPLCQTKRSAHVRLVTMWSDFTDFPWGFYGALENALEDSWTLTTAFFQARVLG
jgi:hypothetical protein